MNQISFITFLGTFRHRLVEYHLSLFIDTSNYLQLDYINPQYVICILSVDFSVCFPGFGAV